MTYELDASDAVDCEKALVLSAVAATAWCARGSGGSLDGRQVLARMMLAASWVSRSRRHRDLPPLSVADLVDNFTKPVETWLPSAGTLVLVEDGQPTAVCDDLADDASGSPLAEVEQRVIRKAMDNLRGRPNEEAAYTKFRRFLVEHAHAQHSEAGMALMPVGLDLAQVYERVGGMAVARLEGRDVFFPCPRCRWPMAVLGTSVTCRRSPTCIAAGARFDLREGRLVPLSKLSAPTPKPVDGMAALRPGVWRFTVLPGLEELELERRLAAIDGVEIRLWPFVDAYDLDVRRGAGHWRIDVKDHSSATSLAQHLNEKPVTAPTWIVVPAIRRDQVSRLQRLVSADMGYRFADVHEIVRRVQEGV